MPEQNSLGTLLPGIRNDPGDIYFDAVFVSVGHKKLHTANGIAQNFQHIPLHTIPVTVTGNLVKPDMGVCLRHSYTVFVVVSQMDYMLGTDSIDCIAHKAPPGMGIGQHKNFQSTRTSSGVHIVILIKYSIAGILTGGNQMQKNPDPYSMEDALRLINTPAGQQLLALLRQTNPEALSKAQSQAAAGDYSKIAQTLAPLLASEDVKKLLKQLGG